MPAHRAATPVGGWRRLGGGLPTSDRTTAQDTVGESQNWGVRLPLQPRRKGARFPLHPRNEKTKVLTALVFIRVNEAQGAARMPLDAQENQVSSSLSWLWDPHEVHILF